jgi:MarR family transcriptional regulator, 2-MHQ and catechol-resistance regulon repressor
MTPPSVETPPALGDRITLVGLILEAAAGLRRTLAPGLEGQLGVTGQAFEILLRLSRSPGHHLRMTDLSAQTGLTPSGLTRAVDRLEAAHLAVREVCPSDRRGAFATLTERGNEQTLLACERHRLDIDATLAGIFTAAEEVELARLLQRLRDAVFPEAALISAEPEVKRA